MKKFISSLLLISMISAPAGAADINNADIIANNEKVSMENGSIYHKPAPIEDELIKSDCFPKVLPVYVKENEPITDELIETYEDTGAVIKLWARKKGEYVKTSIDDELVNQKFKSNVGSVSILKKKRAPRIEDNFAKNNIDLKNLTITKAKNCYDFTKAQIPVQLKIIKNLTTKNNILEGDKILFKTVEDVIVNGIRLPKGTKIVGRVETVSESDKMGTPANIIIDNFYVKNNPEICFYGNISKTGANRALWVYPLYQAGNLILYVAGFVFVPIHGGHAKLLTSETYTVFYEVH